MEYGMVWCYHSKLKSNKKGKTFFFCYHNYDCIECNESNCCGFSPDYKYNRNGFHWCFVATSVVLLRANKNCVSSYLEWSRQRSKVFFQWALQDLLQYKQAKVIKSIVPKDGVQKYYYIHITVPGTAPNSLDDNWIVLWRWKFQQQWHYHHHCQPDMPTRITLPPPPFCVQCNCINGNIDQRDQLIHVATVLGLPAANQSHIMEQAKWTTIFFNSDKVPGFSENDK